MRRIAANNGPLITNGNDKHTILLMHFDDNISNYAHGYPTSNVGFNTQSVEHRQGKFGKGLLMKATPVYPVSTANASLLNLLKDTFHGDFTVDYWLFPIYNYDSNFIDISIGENYSSTSYPVLGLGVTKRNSYLSFFYYVDRTGSNNPIGDNYLITNATYNSWIHFAFEKYGDILTIYCNGEIIAHPTNFNPDAFNASKNAMVFLYSGSVGQFSNNLIDEVRISSVARYRNRNFTPPTEPYGQ